MDKFDYLKKKVETYTYLTMYIVGALFVIVVILKAMLKHI
jgi:hypothetical protein